MIASMWLGNLALVIINLSARRSWVTFAAGALPAAVPSIVVFCCIGIYSVNQFAERRDYSGVFGFSAIGW